MSVIGTIRTKFTWLLLILIALAILAFLLMDSTNGQGATPGANKVIGVLNGKKVKAIDMNEKMTSLKAIYPGASDEQIRNSAWSELVDDAVYKPRFESLGVGVTKKELAELIKGKKPHPFSTQLFSRELGENYTQEQLNEFLTSSDKTKKEMAERIVSVLQKAIQEDQIKKKYNSLLSNGIHAPKWMSQDEYVKQNKTVDFDYVSLPYSDVSDDEVIIKDADLKAFAEKNKAKYGAKEGYVLQYVTFEQFPSAADTTKQMAKYQKVAAEFQKKALDKSAQFAQNQSAPLGLKGLNSSLSYQTAGLLNLSNDLEDQLLTANVGDVVGPVKVDGNALIAKILDKKPIADSAKVRHILIKANPQDPTSFVNAKQKADSLAAILKTDKSKFNEFVTEYSDDPGSKDKKGVYDFFPQGRMVTSFNDASFNNKIGSIDVVETQYGYHIIEPLARKGNSTGVKLATIIKGFKAGKETIQETYNKAKEFEKNNKAEDDFVKNAVEAGGLKTTPTVKPSDTNISGIGQDYNVTRWANNNSVGAVKYFSNVAGKGLVARIKAKTKQGEIDLEQNRTELTNEVKRHKKAEILKKKLQENGGAKQELHVLAEKLGKTVVSATEAKFAGSGSGIGFEPEVVSALFFKPVGEVSEAIVGKNGLFVAKVKQFGTLPAERDFDKYKSSITSTMNSKANLTSITNEMTKKGIIKDERYKIR